MHMHVDDMGRGRAVVLLHGMPSAPRHFDQLARRLASTHRVLVPHLPGYGMTRPVAPALGFEARDQLLIDALLERDVREAHLVGFSGGALRALQLATSGALLPLSVSTIAGLCDLSEDQRAGYRQLAQQLRAGADITPLARELFLSPRHAASHPQDVATVEGWIAEVDRLTLAAELESHGERVIDWAPRLASLSCRLLARAGSDDRALPFAHSERLVAAVPRGQLQRVQGAGHALLLEDFEATARALEEHIRD